MKKVKLLKIVEFPNICTRCRKVVYDPITCRNKDTQEISLLCKDCFDTNSSIYNNIEDEILCQGDDITIS